MWAWWAWWACWAWGACWALAAARELDPAACAARFDVQRDKIIRTEESREMGARYLSELDVGARAECLRLCCETDSCDVFVFEEKSPGSCYLFNCGPPEDFRCKFTAHGNFSSGVLALSRRLAELQDRERLAHHERELASLRSPPSSTPSSTPAASSTAPRPLPHALPELNAPLESHAPLEPHAPSEPHAPPPPPLPSRCSRYQFECRAGTECIAVYNACDGVPQCADGSDEAPELGCPPPAAPPARAAQAQPAGGQRIEPGIRQEQLRERAEAAAGGGDAAAEGAEPWPHRLAQAQPQRRYDSANSNAASGSHIFSHKGGLLQDGAFEPPARAPWPQRAWQPPSAGGEGPAAERGWDGYARLDWPDVEPRRAWPVPPPRPEPELPLYMPSKTMPEMPMVYSSQQQTLRDGPKKGFELMSAGPAPQPAAPQRAAPAPSPPARAAAEQSLVDNATKKKALDDKSIESPKLVSGHWTPTQAEREAAHGPVVLEAHSWPLYERGGLSDHPPAAVLLLVLGTLLTAALGALLACRARAARRRRRAHPRLALDADYLVNGMYL